MLGRKTWLSGAAASRSSTSAAAPVLALLPIKLQTLIKKFVDSIEYIGGFQVFFCRATRMGCLGLVLAMLVISTAGAYLLTQLLVLDWRDGAVPRIGTGLPRAWSAAGTSGGSQIVRLPSGAALHSLEGPADPRMSFLLVHDIAEHGGAMADLGQALFKQCDHEGFSCAVFAVDLPGHGHCGDECGQFTMQQMVETVQEASSWIRNRTREGAVITVGQGLGGEVALHAGAGHEPITATIANGLWLPSELSLRPQVALFRGWVGELFSVVMGKQPVCAAAIINFERIFDSVDCIGSGSSSASCIWKHDASLYEDALRDPHNQWFFSVSSLRSLFTYHPPFSASEHNKPVLVMAGGQDRSLPLSHVRASFDRLAGKKFLRYTMGAGHQVFRQEREKAVKLIIPWTNAVLDGTHNTILSEGPNLML